jgi:integrase
VLQKLTTTTVKQLKPQDKPYEVRDTETKGFLLRVQPTGRQTFYFSYRNQQGKKARSKIGVVGNITLQQARDEALRMAGRVSSGTDVQAEKKRIRAESAQSLKNTLGHFIESNYAPWVKTNRKSGESTLASINRHFETWFPHQLPEISVLMVENWRTEKLDKGMMPSTVNRNVAALRAVLSKALEWGIVDHHPLERLKPLKIDNSPKVRFLSKEEQENLTKALENRDSEIKEARARGNQFRLKRGYDPLPSLTPLRFADHLEPMITLSLKTGMRRGELFDLLWNDIDLDSARVTIRAEISKSNRTRHIPLSPIALNTLKEWKAQYENLNSQDRIFMNSKGDRFDNINKAWRTILKDSNISEFRWHDMRHDFASKLVMRGVPLNTVRELCGHTDMNTTLRYAHLAPEHKADAVALLG